MRKRRIADRVPYAWRWFHRLYAHLNLYFWAPCPLCGKNFGGHEWGTSLSQGGYSGIGVCPACAEEAKEMNHQRYLSCRKCHGEGSYPVIAADGSAPYKQCENHEPMTDEQQARDGEAWKAFPFVARVFPEGEE